MPNWRDIHVLSHIDKLLTALENLDIAREVQSRLISNFSILLKLNTSSRKLYHNIMIYQMY